MEHFEKLPVVLDDELRQAFNDADNEIRRSRYNRLIQRREKKNRNVERRFKTTMHYAFSDNS